MQNQLNPSETFVINRILKDWADGTTYYVQAKIYDAGTRALLATKNLTDNGSRWFSSSYKVPHDNVFGNGKRIIIVTSVYTDSGYTTRSENHLDEPEEYLIQQRWNPSVNFGGGDGGWDHKAIVKEVTLAFAEQLAKFKDENKPGEVAPPMDISPLIEAAVAKILSPIESLTKAVTALPKKATDKTDITPVLIAIGRLSHQISDLPAPEKTNLAPVLIEIGRQLNLLKEALINELQTQTSKELTLSFADSPEALQGKKRAALLSGLTTRYAKKQ